MAGTASSDNHLMTGCFGSLHQRSRADATSDLTACHLADQQIHPKPWLGPSR